MKFYYRVIGLFQEKMHWEAGNSKKLSLIFSNTVIKDWKKYFLQMNNIFSTKEDEYKCEIYVYLISVDI